MYQKTDDAKRSLLIEFSILIEEINSGEAKNYSCKELYQRIVMIRDALDEELEGAKKKR